MPYCDALPSLPWAFSFQARSSATLKRAALAPHRKGRSWGHDP